MSTHHQVPYRDAPFDVAQVVYQNLWERPGGTRLHRFRGVFWEVTPAGALSCRTEDDIRATLYRYLADAVTPAGEPFRPDRDTVSNVADALESVAWWPELAPFPPEWTEGAAS